MYSDHECGNMVTRERARARVRASVQVVPGVIEE